MAERKLLRVKVEIVVMVDVDDYRLNYGVEDAATIRDDVKDAVVDALNTGAVMADGIADARRSDR